VAKDDDEDDGRAEMQKLEQADEVPSDPKDWPGGKAKYITFGNEEDDAYGEGATAKLGPAEVEHHTDGSVTVAGEPVDDPDRYKGEPLRGDAIDVADNSSGGRDRGGDD